MTTRVPVRKELLTWAIERAGYAVEQFIAGEPKAKRWLDDEQQPTLKQLEGLAKKLHVPFGYLLLEQPPEEAPIIPMFRTTAASGTPRVPPAVRDMVLLLKRRQEWLSEYLAETGSEPVQYIETFPTDGDSRDLAQSMRELLGLPVDGALRSGKSEDTLRMLMNELARIGIYVATSGVVGNNTHRPIPVEDCRGFVLLDPYAPFIFINNRDAKAAQLFTLAHEFAHVLVGREGTVDLEALLPADDPVERLCNAAAAEFLVPATDLHLKWDKTQDLKELASHFGVSQVVIGRRLLALDIWNRGDFTEFYREQAARWRDIRRKQREQDGGNFYAGKALKVNRRFLDHVQRAVAAGQLSHGQAYRLTGTNRKTFAELMERNAGNG